MPPGCSGAVRPENRVTARSGAPQKTCTGLHLPMNRERKRLHTRSACTSARQKRFAWSGSYARCTSSCSKGIASATSFGFATIETGQSSVRVASMTRR